MSLTTDRNDQRLKEILPGGQQAAYLVLSEEELAKGFVRPVRTAYRHLKCGTVTTMGLALSQTYSRNPKFYSGTFCCHCGTHFDLGPPWDPAFLWYPDGDPVGSTEEEAKMYFAKKEKREAEKHLGGGI